MPIRKELGQITAERYYLLSELEQICTMSTVGESGDTPAAESSSHTASKTPHRLISYYILWDTSKSIDEAKKKLLIASKLSLLSSAVAKMIYIEALDIDLSRGNESHYDTMTNFATSLFPSALIVVGVGNKVSATPVMY